MFKKLIDNQSGMVWFSLFLIDLQIVAIIFSPFFVESQVFFAKNETLTAFFAYKEYILKLNYETTQNY
jgi:hypothetical protein